MSDLNRHPVRRAAVGVLAGTLAFTGGAIAAGISPANAVEGFAFERLAGSDRYGTAAAIALDTFPNGATTAIIARGDDFADALAANYLAGVLDAPILLTDTNDLPAATEAALAELGVEDVIIVGGTAAVSVGVQAELAGDYSVSRLGGADRYLTAELIAGAALDASAGAVGEFNGLRTAILASGQVFADALAAGPIAYAGNHPVLLTRPGDLPSSTADVLADLDIEQVVIVGGTTAISSDVEADAEGMTGADAIRLGGQTRYETAAMIAEAAYESFGFDDTHVNLARGDVFADALAGGPHAGEEMAPILLTASDSLSPATEAFLEEHSDTLVDGHIFGGLAAVSQAVQDAAEEAAQGDVPASNQTFMVTPNDAATLNVVRGDGVGTVANSTADDRTYTVATSAAGATHQIQLVPASSVTVSSTGQVTFMDADGTASAGDNMADFGDVAARIISVNSVPVANTDSDRATAVPVAGTITFTIDGEDVESVVPIVFFDADNDGMLDVDANNAPIAAELFGVGGVTSYINPAATSQVVSSATAVQRVDKDANTFDALNQTFTYDANDTFSINGIPVTAEQFEAALSSGDTVTATYSATAGASSSFALNDVNPTDPTAAPTAAAGTGSDSNDVTVTATIAGDADAVQIQRASVTTSGVGTFATIATEPATDDDAGTAGVQVVYVDRDVPAGSYQYRIVVVNDGDVSAPSPATGNVVTTAPGPDQTQPVATSTTRTADNGFAGVLDAGDVFTVRTDEALAAPAAGSTLRIQDADGTVVDLICGTNATCTVNATAIPSTPTGPNAGAAAGTVLTVTVTGAPTVVAAGGTVGLQYNAATITNTAGINDVAGNRLSVTAGDRVIDAAAGTDTIGPQATDAVFAGGASGIFGNSDGTFEAADVITVTYDEAPVVSAGDTITLSNGTQSSTYACGTEVSCSASGTVLTVTVTDSLAAADLAIDGIGDVVVDTTGVVDAAGNAAGGYPEPLNA